MEVVCIGPAVVDLMARPVERSEFWKEKQRIEEIRMLPGGDAANQSIRLSELGLETALCARIGRDENGRMLRSALERRGVCTEYLAESEETPTGTALVLVDSRGERHTFSVRGAHNLLTLEDCERALSDISLRAVSIASLFSLPGLEKKGLDRILLNLNERKIPVFADLANDKLRLGLAGIRDFLPMITWFLPSLYDALEMTGQETAEKAAAVYRDLGAAGVVIKCGERGCFFSREDGEGWVPAPKIRPVDTTGAGDCMSAVFLSRILRGEDVETACRHACLAASCSTLFPGASSGSLTRELISGWVRSLPPDVWQARESDSCF